MSTWRPALDGFSASLAAHYLYFLFLLLYSDFVANKCIGDDTIAAARQSPNCIKKTKKWRGEKRFSIWPLEFLHPAIWHDHDIDFARWFHPAMWHVALESWHWIHQLAPLCNVAGDFCDNMPLNSPKTSAILEFYFCVRFRPYHRSRRVILHQSVKFYPNRTTLGRKMTSCRFSRSCISGVQ